MYKLGTIREFRTEHFRVVVEALEEQDLDLSWDDSGKTAQDLDAGNLIAFCAHAFVEHMPTGKILGEDYLGNCIYRSLRAFEDHRECGRVNRRNEKRYGKYQVYRKNRPYEHCLRESDKLKKRGFSSREKAEIWAKANSSEPYEIFETGRCGSYFFDMISEAISEARKNAASLSHAKLREVNFADVDERNQHKAS